MPSAAALPSSSNHERTAAASIAGVDGTAEPSRLPRGRSVPLVIGSRVVAVVQLEFSPVANVHQPTIATICSCSARARRRRSTARGSTSPRSARARKPKPFAHARIEELEGHQQTEVALRASEARYRTLAARTNRLHGLTAALSEAVTVKAVAEAVVRQGKIAVGATSGEVALLIDNGARRSRRVHSDVGGEHAIGGLHASRPRSVSAPPTSSKTRQPVFIGSFAEWQQRYWRSASIAADGGYVSSATLPLFAGGQAVPACWRFTSPRR